MPGHARDGEGRLAANGDAVGEAEPFEPGAKRGVRAVVGIDDDAGDREAGLQDGRAPAPARCATSRETGRVGGMPAAAQRAASSVHDAGRYRSNASGHVRPSAINALDTATWQLPILPSAPQYLPLHAGRLRALLREARVVEREDARRATARRRAAASTRARRPTASA